MRKGRQHKKLCCRFFKKPLDIKCTICYNTFTKYERWVNYLGLDFQNSVSGNSCVGGYYFHCVAGFDDSNEEKGRKLETVDGADDSIRSDCGNGNSGADTYCADKYGRDKVYVIWRGGL